MTSRPTLHRRLLQTALVLILTAGFLAPTTASADGTIEGKVVFSGKPRRNPLIRMGADPNCLEINQGKKVVNHIVKLGEGGAVGEVFVHLTGEVTYSGGVPTKPVVIVQEGCIYHPKVSGGMVGQTLKVINKDATLHNIHAISDKRNNFNVGQPKAGMEYETKLASAEVMLKVKCDVHPWMQGYIGVLSHPYFAVTNDDGTFRIENVPAGSYSLQALQARLGTEDQQIEVKDGETVTVEFTYGPPTSAELFDGGLPVKELTVHTAAAR